MARYFLSRGGSRTAPTGTTAFVAPACPVCESTMKSHKAAGVFALFLLMLIVNPLLFPEPDPPPSTLRIGIDSFPSSLNPVYTTSETSQAIMNKVYQGLFYFDKQGNPLGELVEKTYLKNPRVPTDITLELKKKVFFSDGKELDAEDVVHTIKLLKNDAFNYPYLSNLRFIRDVEKIDRFTLKLTLAFPFAAWKNYLTFKILNSREIKSLPPNSFRDKILTGSGPFKIKTIIRPSKIILEPNHAGFPSNTSSTAEEKNSPLEYLEYTVTASPLLSPLKLITKEIDICELQPETAEAYTHTMPEWHKGFGILKYKKFGYTYLVFNLKNSLITRNLRYFFYNELINGDFLDRFLMGRGERVISPFLLLNDKVKTGRFDIPPPVSPVQLKILTNSESKLRKELVVFLIEKLKPFKIILQPVYAEYHSFLDYLKNGRFDIAISGYMLDMDYDLSDILAGNGFFNYARFRDQGMDSLLEQGLKEPNPRKREEIYLDAHRVWLENLPFLPLFNLYYYVGVSRDIEIPPQTYEIIGSEGDFLYNILDWKKKK